MADELDRLRRSSRVVESPLVPAGEHLPAPLLDGLAGGREAEAGERTGEPLIEEGSRPGKGLGRIAVGADLVVADDEPLRRTEPDLHGIEPLPRRPTQDARPVRAFFAEPIALAEVQEHLRKPGIRDRARVRRRRGRSSCTAQRASRSKEPSEQPADHDDTESACQMSRAYSRMVRSLENFPIRAMFRMAIFVQRSGS